MQAFRTAAESMPYESERSAFTGSRCGRSVRRRKPSAGGMVRAMIS